jgi:hypothetical protein
VRGRLFERTKWERRTMADVLQWWRPQTCGALPWLAGPLADSLLGFTWRNTGESHSPVALNATWDRRVHSSGRRGDSTWGKILSIKKRWTNRAFRTNEIWGKIRYLDPAIKRSVSVVIITVLAILAMVGVVVALLYSRGL